MKRSTVCFGLLFALCAASCAVDKTQRGLPGAAQSAIDTITEDISAGRDDKIYQEAADEWRLAATPEESRENFERVRRAFGRVLSRALVEGRETQTGGAHTLVVTYNTRFESADAIETFTLIERAGRWQLARYTAHSDVLK